MRRPPAVFSQARLTSSRHSGAPVPLNATETTHEPSPSDGRSASASLTPFPSSTAGPTRTGCPSSSGTSVVPVGGGVPGCDGPCTTWKLSCAVRPITSVASRGSCSPGSSMRILRSPTRARVGSVTPSASMRPRSTSRARFVDSRSAFTRALSLVSRTIWVPPLRSRPNRGEMDRAASSARPITAKEAAVRQKGARERARTGDGDAGMQTPRKRPRKGRTDGRSAVRPEARVRQG